MTANKCVTKSSACEYLENCNLDFKLDFNKFVHFYSIFDKYDIEKLIIYAISYNKLDIINALFNHNNGYVDELLNAFEMDINSLYSVDCLSLIPSIKEEHDKKNDISNLFSKDIIQNSKQIIFDNQIQTPTTSIVSKSIFKHLIITNEHFEIDMIYINDLDNYYKDNSLITINLKPCYMTYFDHCILLGHYKMALQIIELGGWHTFINGNFMIYLREILLMKSKYNKDSYNNEYVTYYKNIVSELYSMGADINNIYHNHQLKGFAFLYDIITDCNGIFETRQMALAKIIQHFIRIDLDICFTFTSFVPYINTKMIQKLPHQKGMVLVKHQ